MSLDRRSFAALLAFGAIGGETAFGQVPERASPEAFILPPNGWVPNNQRLPVLLYRRVLASGGADPAVPFEAGVPAQWLAAAMAQRRL
ncbi:MAG: hypothetical protein WDN69_09870 [Aliidongia sp.]